MILIYLNTKTPRVCYAMDVVFKDVLNTPYELTTDLNYFEKSSNPKFVYANESNNAKVFILANSLLFETGIKQFKPCADKSYSDFPHFFASNTNDFLGYDVFSMVFYFVSRYEEYLDSQKDNHQRFKAENSLSFQYQCLSKPFLNHAIFDFSEKLKSVFPELIFEKRTFNFVSTIDIDNAFAYSHKGLRRNVGGFFKDLANLKCKHIFRRIISNINDLRDPYNTFETINAITNKYKATLKYFILIGDYSKYDKNPHYKNKGFRRLLKSLSKNHELGLHPSYQSFEDFEKIKIEQNRLSEILEKKIAMSRCHFLRVNLQDTYRTIVKQGITDDYTMIFASQSGFRTGLCVPFKWFDMANNEATNLTIHTSVVMEGTLRDYKKYNKQEATNECLSLLNEVKNYGGEFISIFHNDTFVAEQTEWVELYETILKEIEN